MSVTPRSDRLNPGTSWPSKPAMGAVLVPTSQCLPSCWVTRNLRSINRDLQLKAVGYMAELGPRRVEVVSSTLDCIRGNGRHYFGTAGYKWKHRGGPAVEVGAKSHS